MAKHNSAELYVHQTMRAKIGPINHKQLLNNTLPSNKGG